MLMDSTNHNYHLITYLNMLLHASQSQKNSHLKHCVGWMPDSPKWSQPKDTATDSANNPGGAARLKLIAGSAPVRLRGKLQCDIFQCEKPLVDGIEISIRLWPASPAQFLQSSENDMSDAVIVWELASLDVPRITPKVMPRVGRAVYPFLKNKVLRYSLLQDAPVFGPQVLVNGYLPRRVIVAFQNLPDAYGDLKRNRLAFEGGLLKNMVMRLNSFEIPRKHAYRDMNFQSIDKYSHTVIEAYMNLYEQLKQIDDEQNCGITLEEFYSGYTLYPFDLTVDPFSPNDENMSPRRAGVLDLLLEFAERPKDNTGRAPPKEDLNCFVFLQFEQTLIVHPNRECQIDDHSSVAHPAIPQG